MKRKPQAERKTAQPGRQHWISLTAAGTRGWVPGDVAEASRAFDGLTPEAQLGVVQEIVETRAAELARAYPGVIDVSFGYRRRRGRGRGHYDVVPTACVRFVVKRKVVRNEVREYARIPERLFAYCWIDGQRRLCAAPTDVEDAAAFAGARAQTPPIHVKWKTSTANGAVACALVRRDGEDGTFALSCRHVLCLTDLYYNEPTWGAEVSVDPGTIIGRTRAVAGVLRSAPDRSFDAQLLQGAEDGGLRQALDGLTLSGYAQGFADLPAQYFIRRPGGPEIAARKLGLVYDRPYRLTGVGQVVHYILVESSVDTATEPGHSGSPVVSERDGGLLLGMHVAGVDNGPGNRFAYMIPAWQLFDPSNYDGADNAEHWELTNP